MSTNSRRLGKYELLERLGQGGIASVWKARDTQLQRYVAVKMLHPNLQEDPNFITRFEREAQLIASLHHPNIVQVHDYRVARPPETTTPTPYMVMNYIEGGTLAEYIASTSAKGTIPTPAHIVQLFTSISLAVDYAHGRGMIHRDIKPANILLDKRITARNPMGEPILTDFGVARMLAVSSGVLSNAQMGTPLYIAPEQVRGYSGNERSDLYALGVILYEMVTGVPPFRGNTPNEVLTQQINADPVAPSEINPRIPASLSKVILQALAKEPDARFASACKMTAAIAQALDMPVPETLQRSGYLLDVADRPTHVSSDSGSAWQVGITPLLTPLPQPAATPGEGSGVMNIQGASSLPPSTPPSPSSPSMPLLPSSPSRPRRRWRAWYPALLVLAIIVFLCSSIGIYLLFSPSGLRGQSSQVVGQAYFVSSGQYDPSSAQGIADQLHINLHNIPNPQSGERYYVWLLGDIHPYAEAEPLQPLFKLPLLLTPQGLPVKNGNASVCYMCTTNTNDNLLSQASRLLITEESAQGTPRGPAADRSTWRYYAEIPQTSYGSTQLSVVDNIRHLLYKETKVSTAGLPGGLDVWLMRNTENLMEAAVAARDDYTAQGTNADQMRTLFVCMLDYLDGVPNVHIDVSSALATAAPCISQVGLLSINKVQQQNGQFNPAGYIEHISQHLESIIAAPDVTLQMKKGAQYIYQILNSNVTIWLNQARVYARQLALMDTQQLSQQQTLTMIDALLNDVTYACIGKLDSTTELQVPGVLQAHYKIQGLATLTITDALPQSV